LKSSDYSFCTGQNEGETKEKRDETLISHDYSFCTGETSALTEASFSEGQPNKQFDREMQRNVII